MLKFVNTDFLFLVMVAVVVGLIALAWKGPELFAKYRKDPIRTLARMARQAKRHNTIVRYHNHIPFVISHQRRGLNYMLEGRFVSREDLIKALSSKSIVEKVEEEEQMRPASETRLTMIVQQPQQQLSRQRKK